MKGASVAERWLIRSVGVTTVLALALNAAAAPADRGPLDPPSKIHIPIGIPNTLDSLKTFVEYDGSFSPGVGTYGIYFWFYDADNKLLLLPDNDKEMRHRFFSTPDRRLVPIPFVSWEDEGLQRRVSIAHLMQESPAGRVHVVLARVGIRNLSEQPRRLTVYAALRPLGPAGGDVGRLEVSENGDALLVDGRPALVATEKPDAAGVVAIDTIADLVLSGNLPAEQFAESASGDCSGVLRFDLKVPHSRDPRVLSFVCPVLPGRRAARHEWDGVSEWAQFDLAKPNPQTGGVLQPDPGLDFYRNLDPTALWEEAFDYWHRFYGDRDFVDGFPRWNNCLRAILAHAAISMNEGAPDVAVVNYNVFNRDGVYVANILQKSGKFDLAAECIEYFLKHPFNGRIYPEADNPGQILWVMGEHWLFTRDREWLERIYPGARKLAAMIRYYRTTPGPHWVNCNSLEFGEALPANRRQELKPGRCDGHHPEYTEAFDIAGLRGAVILAEARGEKRDAEAWGELADLLFKKYDEEFGENLANDYGSYSVLWPCRLYLFSEGTAHNQFKAIGPQKPSGWRYFPLARAHQGLLAGNREAGWKTLETHLSHEQMQGWYAFDEGGKSGPGGWHHVRTTWNPNVAMPHGWAIAEVWLLMRDCLVYEDGDRLVLLGGVSPDWFRHQEVDAGPDEFSFNLPTHFGRCRVRYTSKKKDTAVLRIEGDASPPGGFVLRLPRERGVSARLRGTSLNPLPNGDIFLPANAQSNPIELSFSD